MFQHGFINNKSEESKLHRKQWMLVTLILLRLFTLSQQVCEWAINLTLKVGLSGIRGSDGGLRPAAMSQQVPWHLLSCHTHQALALHLLGSRKLQSSSLSDSLLANMFSNILDTGQFLCVKRKKPKQATKLNLKQTPCFLEYKWSFSGLFVKLFISSQEND